MDRVVEGLCRFFIFLVDRCIERRQPPKKAKFKIDPTEDDEANLDRDPKPSWLVYVGASASLLSAVSVGFCLGYNSPALPSMIYNGTHYANDTATYRIVSSEDTNTLSWIGSVMGVGALVGSLLSGKIHQSNNPNEIKSPFYLSIHRLMEGPTNQYFGRKIGLILSAVGSTFSWLLIAMTLNAAHLILFRLLTGFFAGLSCGIAPTYCAEIATKEIRGRLGTYFQIGITIGIFLMSALGLAFHWRNLAIVCILAPFCTAILLLFVPETPYFLLKCRPNDPNYALNKSLRPLRDAKSPLQKELNEILSTVQTGSAAFFSLEMFTQRDFLSPLHHALLLMFFQQFSGTL